MPDSTEPKPLPLTARLADGLGMVALLAIAFLVTLWFEPGLKTRTPAIVHAKQELLGILAVVVLGCTAVLLWTERFLRWRRVLPAMVLLAALLAVMSLGTWLGGGAAAWRLSWFRFLALLAGGCAPLFLVTERRIRWVIGGAAASCVAVALLILLSFAGVRQGNRIIYGLDPRDLLESAELQARYKSVTEGGAQRSHLSGTLGNPEYAGGVLALGVVLCGAGMLSAFREKRFRCGLLALGGVAASMVALAVTQTRGAWIGVAAGGIAWLLLQVRPRGWIVALCLAVIVLGGLLGGRMVLAAAVLLSLCLLAVAVFRSRNLREMLAPLPSVLRGVLLASPLLALGLLVAFSTPGPWNPMGARLLQRFGAALSSRDASIRERVLFYMIAAELTSERPILGHGAGSYGSKFQEALANLVEADRTGTMEWQRDAIEERIAEFSHGDYFQFAAEHGLLGLFLLLGFFTVLLAALHGIAGEAGAPLRPEAVLVACGVVTLLAIAITSGPFQFPARLSLLWSLVGAGLGIAAMQREEPQ